MIPVRYPLEENPFDSLPWPDNANVALVLDGCAIENLPRQILDWSNEINLKDCLYVNTAWAEINDVSPWLIWLNGPDDPFLERFVAEQAEWESGYLLVTAMPTPAFGRWMRQRIQIERAPGYQELVRISHPALAASALGGNLIQGGPADAIWQLILPDRTLGQWVIKVPTAGVSQENEEEGITLSPRLTAAFEAFNTRKANLMIWDNLEEELRAWLGGPELVMAWPNLCRLSRDAAEQGRTTIRSRMQYLIELHAKDTIAA